MSDLVFCKIYMMSTHRGRVTYIFINKLGHHWFRYKDLLPDWCLAIIWTNTSILLILTHGNKFQWNLNWNTTILIQAIFQNAFFLNKIYSILIQISPKLIFKGLLNNISALVQIMAGTNKPLPEPILTRDLWPHILSQGHNELIFAHSFGNRE